MGAQDAALIADHDQLRALESDWRRLAELRGNAFLTPEWFWSWLAHYGETAEPAVVVVRAEGGRPIGVMPLVAQRDGRVRTLRFAGGALADHLHPVCAAADEQAVARATATALSGAGSRFALAVLDNVEECGAWWQTLGALPPFIGRSTLRHTTLPRIEVPSGGWDAYLASRTPNFREQARRYPRRLERAHRVTYRLASDPGQLERDMATLFALHDARWSTRGGSTLASPRARSFHLDFARCALARGWLRLWILELDGVAVAAWHGWRLGERYAYYQAGFDPAWERLSVGFVLMVHTVRSALEEGASRYELLLGDEPYKARFANAQRSVCTAILSRSRAARLLSAAEALGWRASQTAPAPLRSLTRTIGARLPGSRRR